MRNWFREKWPILTITAGLLLAAAFGFGIGYIAADQSNHAPIIIEQNGPIH